jgi:glycosyltransferase involved in cell wall biosynthesis
MRIGIDARPFTKHRTGIGNYILGLVELLPRLAPQHEYFLYSNRPIDLPSPDGAFHQRTDAAFGWWPGSFWLLGRAAHLMRRDALDIFWEPHPILPLGIGPEVLRIVTVHDLVWLRFPETMTRYNFLVQVMCARKAITNADLVLVNSRSTQDELVQMLGVPRGKTRVVYPGVADRYKPQDPAKAAQYISQKYGVSPRYLVTVGIVHPRKNQQFLIRVLRILKDSGQLDCPLLVAGPMGWKNSTLFREIQAARLTEDDIRFLGYVPDEDMPLLYGGAQAFLFPTLYEGFGLPPVEAMACGTPVIASDAPCMPEVLGDAALLEPLTSHDRFATAIRRVLTNEQSRDALRSKGIQRARSFRNQSSVRQLVQIFETARNQ